MILSNTEDVPGKQITGFFGVVSGSTVRAKHVGKDIMASFKNIIGGELKAYTQLIGKRATTRLREWSKRRNR